MKPHFDRHGNFWKTSNCVLHVPSDDMKTTVGNTDASEPLEKLSFVEKQTRLEKAKEMHHTAFARTYSANCPQFD